ncbi:MAG: glycine/betaine/sarcosine/D-proline family reductase selenoprotein B [Rhodospirillaceae bacterium]|nr:glycine/betaine/sarcosine/D-proline family reductase selenoprotein B [Rhodospirillaceae bacterium]
MVRLADLSQAEREGHLNRVATLPKFESRPWVRAKPLARRRVALVTTAGLHRRGDRAFDAGGTGMDYRVIPGEAAPADLVMSHLSVNFDRSGFQSDWNVVFPLDRLKELVREKVIGSLAAFHYSFMGAISPVTRYEAKARELAALLKEDNVDAVLLTPV